MNRIKSVRFRLPQKGRSHILVTLEGGQTLRFYAGQMFDDMTRLKMTRLKVYIIHARCLERATANGRHPNEDVQNLLAEFHTAAEQFGVRITDGPQKRGGTQKGARF